MFVWLFGINTHCNLTGKIKRNGLRSLIAQHHLQWQSALIHKRYCTSDVIVQTRPKSFAAGCNLPLFLHLIAIISVAKYRCCICTKNTAGRTTAERKRKQNFSDRLGAELFLKTFEFKRDREKPYLGFDIPVCQCASVTTNSLKALIISF